ncbi:hypothetical protein NQ315_014605 [Exocentrus adspersus]|uniref:Integrase p58-like C-terminal domain-containing protein n=1 Tax=Exocentrus adspersus TaxID=1586481 RepID=A0AAV8VQJ7_9CUCU|nr:hypothetical protein NQ315_014605 [Exocentrus adspersus]
MKSRYACEPMPKDSKLVKRSGCQSKGKSPKLQKSLEGPYIIVTRLNDVVYRIQKNPQAKIPMKE